MIIFRACGKKFAAGILIARNRALWYQAIMNTWKDLIDAWGGPHAFAASIGISAALARMMSSRNSVKADYWPIIVARAPQAGLQGITYELLASLKKGRQARAASTFRPGRQIASGVDPVAV